MKKFMIGGAMRLFFIIFGSVIWLGIWLTGFDVVHWVLYIPAIFAYFAAITGICPGIIITKMLLPPKTQ